MEGIGVRMDKALVLLKDDLALVEARIRDYLESDVPLIRKVGEYVLSSGGKRLRPLLLLLSARLSGYRGEQHIALASVIEFIHTATLLHDDVVDSAVLRRGNASANTVWGNEASVLVGDYLFAKSFSIMVRNGNLRVFQVLSDATTTIAEGEVQQLLNTCDVELGEECYMRVVRSKTAILIAAACRCGGLLGDVSADQEEALADFGMDLGVAFQLMDDALDYVADEAEFGKAKGHDLAEGKMTLPLIETLRRCNPAERAQVEEIVNCDELSPAALQQVSLLIERHDGIGYTQRRAAELVARAKTRLAVFPESSALQAMHELADFVVQRRR